MQLWQSIVLGLVEGITEYLPVSSTGHLIITGDLLGLDKPETKEALNAFNIIVQGGAILAVLGLYFPRFLRMFKGLLGLDPVGFKMFANVVIAFIPAAVVGVALNKVIESKLFHLGPVVLSLVLGGFFMIGVELWRRSRRPMHGGIEAIGGKTVETMTPADALVIGLLQIVALWPGTSRSMMTITAGYFRGLKPSAAAEFSFLLGMPTLLAATLFKLAKDLTNKDPGHQTFFKVLGTGPVLVGIAVAAVSAAIAVKWLVGFLTRHGLAPFGYYRIVLGVVMLILALSGVVTVGA
ncbi:MAG: undecaprenyl-diphosphate phosphatase [Phycisphaerales bacterium]|nr:undecaprenyl-diphosphate phosphatase [Phycisphaerales bacterium]